MPELLRANIAVMDHVTADKRADTLAMLEKYSDKIVIACIITPI